MNSCSVYLFNQANMSALNALHLYLYLCDMNYTSAHISKISDFLFY